MDDFFERRTNDYEIIKGDTVNLGFQFKDEDGNNQDITGMNSKFNVKDPYSDEVIASLEKTHNDSVTGGGGIYYNGDTEVPSGMVIETHQCVVVLSYTDTANYLEEGVYPFDLEFYLSNRILTKIRGNLIVKEEITPSV